MRFAFFETFEFPRHFEFSPKKEKKFKFFLSPFLTMAPTTTLLQLSSRLPPPLCNHCHQVIAPGLPLSCAGGSESCSQPHFFHQLCLVEDKVGFFLVTSNPSHPPAPILPSIEKSQQGGSTNHTSSPVLTFLIFLRWGCSVKGARRIFLANARRLVARSPLTTALRPC